jgi:PTS system mannose-specific IID component
MRRAGLFSIFLRSLSIQSSFNFWRMQNLGFAFAILPLIRQGGDDRKRFVASLTRHLQMFNTHPYLTAPIIGSVVMIEEEGQATEADHLKAALMGPYAGIGDSFFWGALCSFASVAASILALSEALLAPLVYLLLYNPAHLWVRGKGFMEGYRRGKSGIDFIRGLDLPGVAGRIRLLTLILIGVLAAIAAEAAYHPWTFLPEIPVKAVALALILLCFLGVRKGISSTKILYGTTLLCMALSI